VQRSFPEATIADLVRNLRSSKLGGGFADWIEKNWRDLRDNPKLQPKQAPAPKANSTSGNGENEQVEGGGSKKAEFRRIKKLCRGRNRSKKKASRHLVVLTLSVDVRQQLKLPTAGAEGD